MHRDCLWAQFRSQELDSVENIADRNCASFGMGVGLCQTTALIEHLVKSRYLCQAMTDGRSDMSLILVIHSFKAIILWNKFVAVLKTTLRFQFCSELCSKTNVSRNYPISHVPFTSGPVINKHSLCLPEPHRHNHLEPSVQRRESWVQFFNKDHAMYRRPLFFFPCLGTPI